MKARETGFNFTCQHTWMNLSFHLGHRGKPGSTNDSIKTDWTITCGQIEGHTTMAVQWKSVKVKPMPCIQRFHSLTNRFVFFSWSACKRKPLCTIGHAPSFSKEAFQTRQYFAEGVKRLQSADRQRWRKVEAELRQVRCPNWADRNIFSSDGRMVCSVITWESDFLSSHSIMSNTPPRSRNFRSESQKNLKKGCNSIYVRSSTASENWKLNHSVSS